MDKNMISIDNLVRQRLAGGEEERPAAGWMQMRNLLDEKMPTSAPGTNWRRVFGIGAALLLLSGLTVGGYEMLSANRGTGNGATNNTMAVNTTAAGTAVSSNTTRNNNSSSNTVSNNNSSNNSNNNGAATGIAVGNNNNNASDNSSNNNSNTNSNAAAATSGAAVSNNHTGTNEAEANKPSGNDNNGNALAHNATKPQNTNTPVQSGTGNDANTNNGSAASQVPTNATAHANGNSSNTFNGSSANNNTQPAQPVAANKPAQAPNQPQAANNTIVHKDSMTVVQVHEKAVKQTPPVYPAKFEHDTVGIDKAYTVSNQQVAVNNNTGNNTPTQNKTAQKGNSNNGGTQKTAANNNTNNKLLAANTPAKTNTPSTPVPQSAAPATLSKDASLAANAKKKRNGWSMESLDQMLQDVKYNIGRVEFYPGLIGGINSTFFPGNTMGGFHIGVTGDFVINKQWSLFAELKYFNRFNNGDVIRDHYTTYTPNANGYTKDSVINFFNFSTLQSLELPITVRYNIRKFTLFAGGNLSYNFAVNASTLTNPNTSTTAEPGNSTNPNISLSDFGARLGLGYLFGAAYKVAPGMTVDLRMTNNFWDNAKGNGAHIISNQLYRSPSVQLSFGYRLGADEKPTH